MTWKAIMTRRKYGQILTRVLGLYSRWTTHVMMTFSCIETLIMEELHSGKGEVQKVVKKLDKRKVNNYDDIST